MEFFRDTQNNLKIAFLNEAPARSYAGKKKGFLIVNCSLFLVYVIIFTGNEINPKAFVWMVATSLHKLYTVVVVSINFIKKKKLVKIK